MILVKLKLKEKEKNNFSFSQLKTKYAHFWGFKLNKTHILILNLFVSDLKIYLIDSYALAALILKLIRAGNLLIRSFRSNQMSDCERFAQIAQDK